MTAAEMPTILAATDPPIMAALLPEALGKGGELRGLMLVGFEPRKAGSTLESGSVLPLPAISVAVDDGSGGYGGGKSALLESGGQCL